MRPLLFVLRSLLIFIALSPSFVFAADDFYYWMKNGGGSHFDSPQSACVQAATDMATGSAGSWTYISSSVTKQDETTFRCFGSFARKDSSPLNNYLVANISRVGSSCKAGYTYNSATGVCAPPSDAECRLRDPYTKVFQFAFINGAVVLQLDSEVKDGCIYDVAEPKNCTDTQCDVEMSPVGNDDMSDNTDNPTQDLQDYLDELSKKFDCVKTPNGTVGCSNSETTPPDIDPDNKCPPGYSWSGTSCFSTPGGPADHDNSGPEPCTSNCGTTGGGDNGGGTGGGDTGGGDTGGGNTGGGTGGGTDGDKDNSVEGTACDKVFKCTGDAVACAMAEKQKQTYCEAHELADTEKGFGEITNELADEKFQMKEGDDIDVSDLFGKGTRFLPSSCPAIQTVSLSIGPLSLDWEPVCYYAEIMGNFGVAMCSLFFALYVGRAFGGE